MAQSHISSMSTLAICTYSRCFFREGAESCSSLEDSGEYISMRQNIFNHYRNFQVFDIQMYSWNRVDMKVCPSVRWGHRMALWKVLSFRLEGFMTLGLPVCFHAFLTCISPESRPSYAP